eukprot:1884718-Amphidinium_carterae.1
MATASSQKDKGDSPGGRKRQFLKWRSWLWEAGLLPLEAKLDSMKLVKFYARTCTQGLVLFLSALHMLPLELCNLMFAPPRSVRALHPRKAHSCRRPCPGDRLGSCPLLVKLLAFRTCKSHETARCVGRLNHKDERDPCTCRT